jgi:hypothetical protein
MKGYILLRTELGKFHEAGRKRFKGFLVDSENKLVTKKNVKLTFLLKDLFDFNSEHFVADHLGFTMGNSYNVLR